jgi:riboflavin synthase
MFTGLITQVATVRRIDQSQPTWQLDIQLDTAWPDIAIGESISIAGLCLSVERALPDGLLQFSCIPETIARSTIAFWLPGTRVNCERALCLGDRMGGHTVQGHVDGVGTVYSIQHHQQSQDLIIHCDKTLAAMCVEKGFIAIDGTSLTITQVSAEGFGVSLIPITLASTAARFYQVGTHVNLEIDILAKTIQALLANQERLHA